MDMHYDAKQRLSWTSNSKVERSINNCPGPTHFFYRLFYKRVNTPSNIQEAGSTIYYKLFTCLSGCRWFFCRNRCSAALDHTITLSGRWRGTSSEHCSGLRLRFVSCYLDIQFVYCQLRKIYWSDVPFTIQRHCHHKTFSMHSSVCLGSVELHRFPAFGSQWRYLLDHSCFYSVFYPGCNYFVLLRLHF